MGNYYLEMTFELGNHNDIDGGFEAHLDEVAAAFAEITDVDGDVGANLETGRVELCMTVSADNRIEALEKAVVAARTAVHAAGGATPGWEQILAKLIDDDDYLLRSAPSAWSTRKHCTA